MKIKKGEFKCPKCGSNEINDFKKWISKDEYINNELKTKWIFYKESGKKWTCCKTCDCDDDDDDSWRQDCEDTLLCCCCCSQSREPLILIYPCVTIFYILIFCWVDFIYYLCCTSEEYIGVREMKNNENQKASKKELFKEIKGATEEEWNYTYKNWKCSNCKYCSRTFYSFIQNSNSYGTTENENDSDNSYRELKDEYEKHKEVYQVIGYYENRLKKQKDIIAKAQKDIIAVIISDSEQKFNLPICCKKTDLFVSIEKKIYEEYPEYKNKECYFLAKGQLVEKNLSFEENNIRDKDIIILYVNDEQEI